MRRSALAVLTAILLAACSDPLATVPKIGDIDVAGPAPVVEAVADPVETDRNAGFFQRLLRKREVAPEAGARGKTDKAVTEEAVQEAPVKDVPEASDSNADTGFHGLFRRKETGKAPETIEPASLPVEPDAQAEEPPARGRLFSRLTAVRTAARNESDMRDAVPGELLPFGDVARACHIKRGDLGREVARYPERGAKYRVFDSAPGNLGLHTFYVTGFSDGCPRQVTAALAVFGTAEMYEALRYSLPVKNRSSKPTDKAYETIKARLCGVGRNKPCGTKISKVERNTVFLSLYDRFEGAEGWTNVLLSDGAVVARDVRG